MDKKDLNKKAGETADKASKAVEKLQNAIDKKVKEDKGALGPMSSLLVISLVAVVLVNLSVKTLLALAAALVLNSFVILHKKLVKLLKKNEKESKKQEKKDIDKEVPEKKRRR